MKRVLLVYLVLIIGIVAWYLTAGKSKRVFSNPKANALKVSKHTREFNESIEDVMTAYYKMANDFVKEDTGSINKRAAQLKMALDNLKVEELKPDTSIYETAAGIWDNAKTEIAGMLSDPSMQAKRESLNLFSNELFTLLLTVRYDLAKLYWQECSSAFGEDTPGNWISASEQSENPYGQKDCATLKKVINFLPADSSKH
ncbi:MAG TPA: hypothetical protein VFP87_06100 [Chitinophagaceae bacterium]|nr:hypothetical protein [Chitinophagaceae bacterium]